jgi:hypothetical protein
MGLSVGHILTVIAGFVTVMGELGYFLLCKENDLSFAGPLTGIIIIQKKKNRNRKKKIL